uniref:Uncharacterized protein n=1 Tax=Magallana gigas TaxID=29159 RepID=A0A8W8JJP3_MAGGI
MLSSTLKQFRHCSRSFSRLCAIQARARQAPGAAVSSKVTQGSEGRRFSTGKPQLTCFKSVQVDLSFDLGICRIFLTCIRPRTGKDDMKHLEMLM